MNSDNNLSKFIGAADADGTINIKLHVDDLETLLEILVYTYNTSRYLSMQELDKGTADAAIKMQRLNREAQTLHEIIRRNLKIGEPESKDIN